MTFPKPFESWTTVASYRNRIQVEPTVEVFGTTLSPKVELLSGPHELRADVAPGIRKGNGAAPLFSDRSTSVLA